mmetsp:Transcript_32568/g.74412  ORF Transcript_32568/g.74412 Transcript_32568/m.74412 type:complete len:216 (+) Transcript_32568:245-892(+)
MAALVEPDAFWHLCLIGHSPAIGRPALALGEADGLFLWPGVRHNYLHRRPSAVWLRWPSRLHHSALQTLPLHGEQATPHHRTRRSEHRERMVSGCSECSGTVRTKLQSKLKARASTEEQRFQSLAVMLTPHSASRKALAKHHELAAAQVSPSDPARSAPIDAAHLLALRLRVKQPASVGMCLQPMAVLAARQVHEAALLRCRFSWDYSHPLLLAP